MEYKIKSKLIDGEVKFGIINDKLEVVLPFKYSNIEEKTFELKNSYGSISSRSYYILSNSNNEKGIFLPDGKSLIEPIYDYIDYIPVFDNKYWSKFIVGQQFEGKMKYGILERQGGSNTYKLVYPFDKADEIKIEDGKVLLYKNKGDRVLRGIFGGSQLGTIDPKYTQLKLGIHEPKYQPIMPDPKKFFADKGAKWDFGYRKWPIEYIMCGEIKNQKEVKGILVRTIEDDDTERWNELVPCEYNNCSIDTTENLINLSQVKNKKELKGLMGFSIYWDIYTESASVYGNCTYKPEFTIPCEYDDIRLLYDASESYERNKKKFFLVKKDGKYGLLKVCYSLVRGPYDNSWYIRNHNPAASSEILLECKYDNISLLSTQVGPSFVFTSDENKGLLIDGYYDKNKKALQTNCEYKSIAYSGKFVITDFNDKKSVFVPSRVGQVGYEFKHTPFIYDSILFEGILQCSKRVEGTQFYDIYNSSLDLKVANANSINFEDNMCKTSTNIGENNTRIIFVNRNGNVQLDEQGENISATYSKQLDCFFIIRNNIIQIKKPQNQRINEKECDIQGDYTIFDFVDSCFVKFKRATENSKMGIYKFVRDSWNGRNQITILLKDEYESIDIVENGTRSIVSKIIGDDVPRTKYGVMENNMGNECIPIEYDSMIFDGENFIATNCENGEIKQIKFDSDGFYLSSETFESQDQKKVLQLNKTSKY